MPADFDTFAYRGWELDRTAQWLRWNEFVCHLPRVLLKMDRASMHESLEVRVPLLDREVIETAARIDWRTCLDLSEPKGKIPLRNALARHVRHQSQTKRGFTVPLSQWFRGPLRPMIEDLVLEKRDFMGLPLERAALAKMYQQHLSGESDHGWGLWILLSLFLWESNHYSV